MIVRSLRGLEPAVPHALPADDDLIEKMARGSEDALAEIYHRHAPAVFALALRLLRVPSDADEVVQETFLALWHRAAQFDAGRGSARALLFSIARNRCIDRLRAGGARLAPLSLSGAVGDGDEKDAGLEDWLLGAAEPVASGATPPAPEDAAVAAETRLAIGAALAELDSAEREVIVLAYHEQLSQSEIARRLEWPLGTVKTRTRRALRNLRSTLEVATRPCGPRVHVVATRSGCAPCS
jgi:RNA polymerase sigma-70 factor, ECF subfamily